MRPARVSSWPLAHLIWELNKTVDACDVIWSLNNFELVSLLYCVFVLAISRSFTIECTHIMCFGLFFLDTLFYVSKSVNQEQKCQALEAGVLFHNYVKRNAEESGPVQSTAKLQNRTADIRIIQTVHYRSCCSVTPAARDEPCGSRSHVRVPPAVAPTGMECVDL
jgi:hypothetical protein